jgi:pyruvate kinase
MDRKLLTEQDFFCYLSGSFGEGHGTTFLEINQINKVLSAADQYQLPSF